MLSSLIGGTNERKRIYNFLIFFFVVLKNDLQRVDSGNFIVGRVKTLVLSRKLRSER